MRCKELQLVPKSTHRAMKLMVPQDTVLKFLTCKSNYGLKRKKYLEMLGGMKCRGRQGC
jgi:hypothetical protein